MIPYWLCVRSMMIIIQRIKISYPIREWLTVSSSILMSSSLRRSQEFRIKQLMQWPLLDLSWIYLIICHSMSSWWNNFWPLHSLSLNLSSCLKLLHLILLGTNNFIITYMTKSSLLTCPLTNEKPLSNKHPNISSLVILFTNTT